MEFRTPNSLKQSKKAKYQFIINSWILVKPKDKEIYQLPLGITKILPRHLPRYKRQVDRCFDAFLGFKLLEHLLIHQILIHVNKLFLIW